jgi:hypothetical protein
VAHCVRRRTVLWDTHGFSKIAQIAKFRHNSSPPPTGGSGGLLPRVTLKHPSRGALPKNQCYPPGVLPPPNTPPPQYTHTHTRTRTHIHSLDGHIHALLWACSAAQTIIARPVGVVGPWVDLFTHFPTAPSKFPQPLRNFHTHYEPPAPLEKQTSASGNPSKKRVLPPVTILRNHL